MLFDISVLFGYVSVLFWLLFQGVVVLFGCSSVLFGVFNAFCLYFAFLDMLKVLFHVHVFMFSMFYQMLGPLISSAGSVNSRGQTFAANEKTTIEHHTNKH